MLSAPIQNTAEPPYTISTQQKGSVIACLVCNEEVQGACEAFIQANLVVTFGVALGVVMYRPAKERWMDS
jgi:hypothetical protein